jgi:hypothetical protein
MRKRERGASSIRPDGVNPEWKLIWKCPVPPKVRTFAWKLARNGLATQASMVKRKIETDSTCRICGHGEEDTFHALVVCPQAKGLWHSMRKCWDLPGDDLVKRTGKEWLLVLLNQVCELQRMMILMVLWRAWHVHNEITHDKPATPVEASKRFLCSYLEHLHS